MERIRTCQDAVDYINLGEKTLNDFYRFYFTFGFRNVELIVVLELSEQEGDNGGVFYILCPSIDRATFDETLYEELKAKITAFFLLLTENTDIQMDCSNYLIMCYPYQYYNLNQSDFSARLEIFIMLYFLQMQIPLWYVRDDLVPILKINFCAWLLNGRLPV